MKGSTILGALSLAGLAAAQPSRHRVHDSMHKKRSDVVVVTEYSYVTATTPDVVVYVDAEGNPLYTSTVGQAAATSVAGVVASVVSSVVNGGVTNVASSAAGVYTVTAASASSVAAATATASASTSASSSSSSGVVGISYSPYSGSLAAGNVGCKTADQVTADFDGIGSEYNLVRIYGTDCNQVENVLSAATAKGMKVFAGVYDINAVASELETIISAVNGNWDSIHTVAIGNELVNSGSASVSAVTAAIATGRTILRAAGYTGPVVTVDTFVAIEEHPELCEASDYAAANAHAYFDGTITAANAGEWLLHTIEAVSSACGGMDTMITETGWPWSGDNNGVAVPSVENQKAAMSSIKETVTSNLIMFTAYNDLWKAAGYLAVEQSFGMYGTSAAS